MRQPTGSTSSTDSIATARELTRDRVNTNLKLLLAAQKCTQAQLARALDMDPAVLNRKISGTSSWKVEEIGLATEHLKVDPADVFVAPDKLQERLENDLRNRLEQISKGSE